MCGVRYGWQGWDHEKAAAFEDPYAKRVREMQAKAPAPSTLPGVKLKSVPHPVEGGGGGGGGGGEPAPATLPVVKLKATSHPVVEGGGSGDGEAKAAPEYAAKRGALKATPGGKMDVPADTAAAPAPVAAAAPAAAAPAPAAASVAGVHAYADLKGLGDPKGLGIDVKQKEQYLSDAEFAEVFKLSKADFAKLAKWKQTELKKKYDMF